jgi:hypothetical protein
MNLLDEQVRDDQRTLLTRWKIPFRQIGREIAPSGIKDPQIIPFLLTLKRPTLFTHDHGFFAPAHIHRGYCAVWLDVPDTWAARYIRLFLREKRFDTQAKRMGIIARAHASGIHFWERAAQPLQHIPWRT